MGGVLIKFKKNLHIFAAVKHILTLDKCQRIISIQKQHTLHLTAFIAI